MLKKVKNRLDKLQYYQKTLQVENILLSLLENLDVINLAELETFVEKGWKKEVDIKLIDWDYTCGDGCCYDWGVEMSVGGEKHENSYVGENTEEALTFILNKLGYKCKISREYE